MVSSGRGGPSLFLGGTSVFLEQLSNEKHVLGETLFFFFSRDPPVVFLTFRAGQKWGEVNNIWRDN